MQVEIDLDDIVQAVTDQIMESVQEQVSDLVREGFNYHEDHFRMSWARMAESELNDLEHSSKNGACPHGQYAYRAIFRVIEEYLRHHTIQEMNEMVGMYREEEPEEEEPEEQEEEEPTEEHDTIYAVLSPMVRTYTVSGSTTNGTQTWLDAPNNNTD